MAVENKLPVMPTSDLIELIKANTRGITGVASAFGVSRKTVHKRLEKSDYVKVWMPKHQAIKMGLITE